VKQLKLVAIAGALMLSGVGLTSGADDTKPDAVVAANATEQAALDVMARIGWGTNAATRELDEDLWHIINQGNLGLIWSRPGLTLRERELIVMAVLVATGSDGVSHLMQHADAVGITDAQVKELILQTIPYSGQPRAIQAMLTLKRVQAARKPKP
jgi:4-carboxymuconolactone decarboxylase